MQVERGVHVDGLGSLSDRRELLDERVADEVDEVRRLGIERPRNRGQRLLDGALGGVRRHEAGVGHCPEYDVAAITRAVWRVERRKRAWRLDDSSDRGRLAKREIVDVLAEVETRGLGDAMNRE